MKKILLLIATAIIHLSAVALDLDSFEFIDKDGNTVPNGATLTLTEVTPDEIDEEVEIMYANVSVRNKLSTAMGVRVRMTITRMDNGAYQICFPVDCKSIAMGDDWDYLSSPDVLAAGQEKSLMTEWIPYEQGGCDVTLTLEVMKHSGSFPNYQYTYVDAGPTITLHYRYGISDTVEGDVTGDGSVDIADVSALINIMLGTAQPGDYPGDPDIDGLGGVDIADVSALINIMLGK